MTGKAAGDAFFVLAGAQKSPGPQGSGAGGDLLLRNDHTKGVGMAIDVFVDNGNSHVGGGEERFIHVSFDEAS